MEPSCQSETSKHRRVLAPFCRGFGLDIGFGGDPITPDAVRVDLEIPYGQTGSYGVQLGGDCRNLIWFKDETLDFVYSSHVLEDFDVTQTEPILREWSRVLKVGGKLILLQPDQPRYLAHCQKTGQPANEHHSIADFSLKYVAEVARRIGHLEVAASQDFLDEYSFFVVFTKTKSAAENNTQGEMEHLRRQLAAAHSQLEHTQASLNRYRDHPVVRWLKKLKGLVG
jgi:predicted SAM-dependent methyltransferase